MASSLVGGKQPVEVPVTVRGQIDSDVGAADPTELFHDDWNQRKCMIRGMVARLCGGGTVPRGLVILGVRHRKVSEKIGAVAIWEVGLIQD